MTADHTTYEQLASQRRHTAAYREGYAEAQRACLIGQAVRERRLALGLSQVELAARAGMTQPALSRLEAGSVIPHHPAAGPDLHRSRRRPHRRDRSARTPHEYNDDGSFTPDAEVSELAGCISQPSSLRMIDAERPFLIGLSWPPRGGASLGWEAIVRG